MVPQAIQSQPTLVEKRKSARRAQRLMKHRKAARLSAKAQPARGKPAAALPRVGKKRDLSWLSQPVAPRAPRVTLPAGRGPALSTSPSPASRINVRALRRGGVSPVMGVYKGVEMIPVVSSNVASIGYKAVKRELYISFLNGSLYRYANVPESVYTRMVTAPSKGRFVWREVRDQYAYERLV